MATLGEARGLANAAHDAGEHAKAIEIALAIRGHFPRDYQTLELLGRLYLEGRMLGEARDAFRAVLDIDPENVVGRAALAMIAEEEGDLDEALDQFGWALDLDPANGEIVAEVDRLHSLLNRPNSQERSSSACSVARRSLLDGKYDSASAWFEEALRESPERVDIAVGLTRALWLARKPSEAEGVAREILAGHPHCLPALAIAAAASSSWGGKEVGALLARAAEVNPGNGASRALFAEAGLAFPAGEAEPAIPDAELQPFLARASSDDPTAGSLPGPLGSASMSGEASPAPAEAGPDGQRARWLAGDALATAGEFRKAVQQYLLVLGGKR